MKLLTKRGSRKIQGGRGGGLATRLEALCTKFTHEIQGILFNEMNPGGWNKQRFQTMAPFIYNEFRAAGVIRNWGNEETRHWIGYPVWS